MYGDTQHAVKNAVMFIMTFNITTLSESAQQLKCSTRHNYTHHNDLHHNDIQHNKKNVILSILTLGKMTFNVTIQNCHSEYNDNQHNNTQYCNILIKCDSLHNNTQHNNKKCYSEHNDNQHNNTQHCNIIIKCDSLHNDTQHSNKNAILIVMTIIITTHSIAT